MKELLERWSQLEPKLCGKDWEGGYCIKFDNDMIAINPEKEDGLSKIQWAVQQAIIEKGWYFTISNLLGNFEATVMKPPEVKASNGNNLTETLLTAYLKVLDA